MKKKLTRNIGLKILSVVLAAILWLLITNVDDPVKTKSFPNIPVTILNEDVIHTPNQMYEIIEGENVTFKVAARRSIIEQLTDTDFTVTADLSKLLNGNTVMIDIECTNKYANEIMITDGRYQTLTIQLEELSEEDFKVNVIPIGEADKEYYIAEKTASPNIIRVSGPKGRIDKIKAVVAEVNVEGASRSFDDISIPKALDEEGNVIDASKLTFSSKYIEVNLTLYKTKTVDLIIKTEGEPAPGYIMTGVDYEPKTVTIAAEDDILKDIKYLEVTQSIEGERKSLEKDIDLRDALVLPKGVLLVEDNTMVSVNIKIEKLETKEITIWPNDIITKNKRDNLMITFNTTGPIRIKLKGPQDEISDITRNTLEPYIDLTDYLIGTYALSILAELPDNTEIYDTPMVSIRLTP